MTDTEVLNALRILAENGHVSISPPNITRQDYEVRCNSKFGSSNIHGNGETVDAAILNALVNKTAARLAGSDADQDGSLKHLDDLSKVSQPKKPSIGVYDDLPPDSYF
jgi:hypothetical protein